MRMKKRLKFIFIMIIFSTLITSESVTETEIPAKTYKGIKNAREIIQNISFIDIFNMPADYWARDAIIEIAALEAIKGYGDRNFRPEKILSKEEAIALIYRMLGKEGEAQKAAEALDAARSGNLKKKEALSLWADGYLKLAADDGVISRADLQTALQRFQPKPGTKNKFVRADPVERQEVATWIAKATKLKPIYGQQNIFNNFNDWYKSDPLKIPYIEAVLQNKIMNGKSGGIFDPQGSVTRAQMAQILKNMEDLVFPARQLERKTGYIERIYEDRTQVQSGGKVNKVIEVRGDDGKIYHIVATISQNQTAQKRKEFTPGTSVQEENELIVYRNRVLGTSESVKEGDKLEFIANADGEVKFIKAIPGLMSVKYVIGSVVSVNETESSISLRDNKGNIITYVLKDKPEVLKDDRAISIAEIPIDREVRLTVQNDLVTRIEVLSYSAGGLKKEISGIVEDNNPSLGYISLYDEEGLGDKAGLRIFFYNPDNIQVEKNHRKAVINDIEPGDTVHIIVGEDGYIKELSGADNYEPIYGKVILKGQTNLVVEYENGTQQVLDIDENVLVVSNEKRVSYEEIRNGDYIRMLVQKTPEHIKIKAINIQTNPQNISNIYKGSLLGVDLINKNITLKHPEKLHKGKWDGDFQFGFLVLKLSDDVKVYDGEKLVDLEKIDTSYIGRDVYVAVQKDFGNEETAQMVSFKNSVSFETLHEDFINSIVSGANQFTLGKTYGNFQYDEGTIIVKDGRLTGGRSLVPSDHVYVIGNRDSDSNTIQAKVIMEVKKTGLGYIQVFRGKLSSINPNKDFTLETFSVLNGLNWEYNDFPKTFSITYNTRILGDEGIIGTSDFNPYIEDSYIGKSIYVVAKGTEALLISTAPYGAFNVRGEVLSIGSDEQETSKSRTSKIKIINTGIYDRTSSQWIPKGVIELNVPINAVLLKNDEVITLDKIEKGDLVRVLKKDDTSGGDAYVILVEK